MQPMKNVLGIFRAACYSPGMAERDEAILRAVACQLEASGYAVNLIHEEEFTPDTPMPDIVLHMTRSPHALDILQSWQESGCQVINSVESVRCVERAALAQLCATQDIHTPKTWIVPTSAPTPAGITFPCWIKRTSTCTQSSDDVCQVTSQAGYAHCMARFHDRGIDEAVVMAHLEGPCIKFYAVKGTDFFHCLPAYDKWNELSLPTRDCEESLQYATAIKCTLLPLIEAATDTPIIYGGDAIIIDSTAYLIDLNDWPSFSSCREEAAQAIAQRVSFGNK